jgi:hypothetical protein
VTLRPMPPTSPAAPVTRIGLQALAWSELPVVTVRPTVFLEGFFLPRERVPRARRSHLRAILAALCTASLGFFH